MIAEQQAYTLVENTIDQLAELVGTNDDARDLLHDSIANLCDTLRLLAAYTPSAEEWRPVAADSSIEVSDEGRVRNASTGKILNTYFGGGPYLRVSRRPGPGIGPRSIFIHKAVAAAFHGPRPHGRMVCHKNGVPTDNRPSNLYYGTCLDNARDRVLHRKQRRAK